MATTNTTNLKKAYMARNAALQTAADATDKEYVAQEKEIQRDTTAALQDAYVQNIRAAQRQGQANRASGISGGQSILNEISRENQYSDARTGLTMNRETELGSIDNQRKINRATTDAEIAANNLSMESQLLDISEGDDDHKREVYAQMLSGGYIPSNAAEVQEMSKLFGIPQESLRAYVSKINQK